MREQLHCSAGINFLCWQPAPHKKENNSKGVKYLHHSVIFISAIVVHLLFLEEIWPDLSFSTRPLSDIHNRRGSYATLSGWFVKGLVSRDSPIERNEASQRKSETHPKTNYFGGCDLSMNKLRGGLKLKNSNTEINFLPLQIDFPKFCNVTTALRLLQCRNWHMKMTIQMCQY